MSLASFLKLVEIQTKVASVIPFALGTLYAAYRFERFNFRNFVIMFVSLISIDMATTAINNYYDYKKAKKTHGYNYESHNAIVRYNLKESAVKLTIFALLAAAVIFGILLYLNTNLTVLLLGAMSFAIGILYSFGPVPISRTPMGEIFSGFFMGFVIVFISAYIHAYDMGILYLTYAGNIAAVSFNMAELIFIFLISLPAVTGIANIMLANNICDIEDDIENKRYTLPIYIGKERALKVFKALYYISYVDLLLMLVLGVAPAASAITLFTFIPVRKNIKSFYEKQTKKDTFVLAVKNFMLMNASQVIAIAVALVI